MTQEAHPQPAPKLLAVIIDRAAGKRLEGILHEKRAYFHYMFHAMGTASSEVLKMFGLSGTEKTVCVCIEQSVKVKSIMTAVVERMEMTRPGNGIAFTIPISGVSGSISNSFSKELRDLKERWLERMDMEAEITKHEARYELVAAVVNQGYSENVMEAAHAAGARGGTIIHARRSGIEDAVKFLGISLQAEKEIVAIVIPKDQKTALMRAISNACGMKTDAHGIVISLPVESCAGIGTDFEDEE
ncbi:MAG: hypothetical protein LBS84_13215 [Clostridiales bacterium]|jgi:nitrogen regulatory protein PII|nr:hypothetical protein [Clostridiales bacterium]